MTKTILTCASVYLALLRLQPVPTLSLRGEIKGGRLDRDPPKDPKLVVSLENTGIGTMHIHEVGLYSKGNRRPSFQEILIEENTKECSYEITESSEVFKRLQTPKPMCGTKLELLTVRPINSNDSKFFREFCEDMKKNDVEIEITFSASSNPLLRFLTTDKIKVKVV